MQLLIDTSVANTITVALFAPGRCVALGTKVVRHHGMEMVLPTVAQLLRGRSTRLRGIVVVTGWKRPGTTDVRERPSGFTHIRSGIITANALAYAWSIPVTGVAYSDAKAWQQAAWKLAQRRGASRRLHAVLPRYEHSPHITSSATSSFRRRVRNLISARGGSA